MDPEDGKKWTAAAHSQPTLLLPPRLLDAGQPSGLRLLLSLRPGTQPLHSAAHGSGAVTFLSGPEGGLSSAEEDLALAHGFAPVTLGTRVLRAETAPLAALAALTLA